MKYLKYSDHCKKSGIYLIKNNKNNKIYIGGTKNLHKRGMVHKYYLKKNTHPNKLLQNDYNLFGENAFEIELVEFCNKTDLKTKEQYWLDFYNCNSPNGYNIRIFADSNKGLPCSEETKRKMSLTSPRNKNVCRKVINIETNEIYPTVVEAQKDANIPYGTLYLKLSNRRTNNTKFKFYDK